MIVVHVKWAKTSGQDVTPAIRHSRIAQYIFMDESYKELMQAVAESDSGTFSSIWDFDQGIALSKSLFIPTEMFGVTKYRYHPYIGIYNVGVWSGLHFQSMEFLATPETSALLQETTFTLYSFFETDDNGFKKTKFISNPDSPTIFFLGDSFTEGLWVPSEDTFVSLFGQKLMSDEISATPINLGVNGYSALEMYWMLEHYAPVLNPKVVVVNLFPNDVHVNYHDVVMGQDIPEEGYREMFEYLQSIQEYCAKHDIELIIAVIPPKEQFDSLRQYSVFQDRARDWSETQGITFLDPRNYFDQFGVDDIYLSWDPHFSSEGHKHYADFLYQHTASIISRATTDCD